MKSEICKNCKHYEYQDGEFGECLLFKSNIRRSLLEKAKYTEKDEKSDCTHSSFLKRKGLEVNVQIQYSDKFFDILKGKIKEIFKIFGVRPENWLLYSDGKEEVKDNVDLDIEFQVHETFGCNKFKKSEIQEEETDDGKEQG